MALDEELPIWDHLEELAVRLRRILLTLALVTIVFASLPSDVNAILKLNFSSYRPLIALVMESIQSSLLPNGVELIAFNWMDTFYIYIIVAVALGVLVTLPYIAYQVYKFINPALFVNERKMAFKFVSAFSILFIIGAIYAYFILLPTTFNVLYRFVYQSNVIPFFSVKGFFNMVAVGILGSGLFYTFPLVIYIIVKADLIGIEALTENRRNVFVGILILTAILTPDPTPFSMLLMAIPFYLLYEFTIQITKRTMKKENKIDMVIERGLEASKVFLANLK
jgi:sec-independent protein translocase protein TatC